MSSPALARGEGNVQAGEVDVDLYRGAAVPFELMVAATPNCDSSVGLHIAWDEADNEVVVELDAPPNALEQFPDVDRTAGVDYAYNPFFAEPEDYQDGRYQLWLIAGSGPMTLFFYDPFTLDLLGSQYDFEVPPPAIPVPFPSLFMTATDVFQPDDDGSLDHSFTFAYDGMLRLDRPEFSHHIVTFPPPNLCGANPFRLDLSTLRPYITAPLPAEAARPFSDYLRGGLLFDITIEPGSYYLEPPTTTLVGTYSGGTGVAGGIPRGWSLDIVAAFGGNAPPIIQWSGAGSCTNHYDGVHTLGINFCGGAP